MSLTVSVIFKTEKSRENICQLNILGPVAAVRSIIINILLCMGFEARKPENNKGTDQPAHPQTETFITDHPNLL